MDFSVPRKNTSVISVEDMTKARNGLENGLANGLSKFL